MLTTILALPLDPPPPPKVSKILNAKSALTGEYLDVTEGYVSHTSPHGSVKTEESHMLSMESPEIPVESSYPGETYEKVYRELDSKIVDLKIFSFENDKGLYLIGYVGTQ